MDDRSGAAAPVHPVGVAPPPTLWTVQVMRGLAALMVVISHSQNAIIPIVGAGGQQMTRWTAIPWGASVDLFFVISGFIMIHASARLFGRQGARAEFLRRRLVRIVPLYWLVTTLFLLLLGAATLKGGDPFPSVRAILSSYAFLPFDTYGNGRLFPVLDLGWTLNYEMMFYALIAVFVSWPRGRALAAIGGAIVVLAALGAIVPGPSAPWFWTRPIVVDFGFGLAVGILVQRGVVLRPAVRILLAVAATALVLADPLHTFNGPIGTTVPNAWPRVLLAGLPISVVLAAALLGPQPPMPRMARPFTRIGDASYSLYLLHPFALIVTEKLAQKLAPVREAPGWLLLFLTVAAALALALSSYRWIELPMTAALSRRIAPRVRQAAPSPVTTG
jgi:exopolysaccharide production protein ExoZ